MADRTSLLIRGVSLSPTSVTKQLTAQLQRLIKIRSIHAAGKAPRDRRTTETVEKQIEIIRQLAIELGGRTREIEGENVHVRITETNERVISSALRTATHKLSLIPGAISIGANGKVAQPNLKRHQRQRRQRQSVYELCCGAESTNGEGCVDCQEIDGLDPDQAASVVEASIRFHQPNFFEDDLTARYAEEIAAKGQGSLATA